MRLLAFRPIVALLLALLVLVMPAAARGAAAQAAPTLEIIPMEVMPGDVAVAVGTGFAPYEDVSLESQLYGQTIDTYVVSAEADGSFAVQRQVPTYAPPGLMIVVVATGQTSGLTAAGVVYIVAPAE